MKEILECDLKLEEAAIHDLREVITLCEKETDYVSRDLLSKILENEEEHLDYLETQLGLIDQIGQENYLQSQV